MKSPTGSTKGKVARITYTIDGVCEKWWPDKSRPCPNCGNEDASKRKRKQRVNKQPMGAEQRRDLIRDWNRQLREKGAIIDYDPTPQPTSAAAATPTVSDLCDLFNEKYAIPAQYRDGFKIAGMRAWRTFRIHVEHLRRELRHEDGRSIPLADLTFGHLQDARLRLLNGLTPQGKPRSAMFVNRVMSTCRLMLKAGRNRGLMTHNPFSADPSVRLVDKRLEKKRHRIMTYEEEAAILATCTIEKKRLHLRVAAVIAAETGMRQNEILKTQRWPVKDVEGFDMPYVDWLAGVIHVTWYYSKTGRDRVVPMTARVREELRRWEGILSPSDPALFHYETIDTAWRGAKKDAGVRNLRFHDLKETAVTRMRMAGVPGDLISLVVDHADAELVESEEMTLRVYTNFNEALQQLVVSKMDAHQKAIDAEKMRVN